MNNHPSLLELLLLFIDNLYIEPILKEQIREVLLYIGLKFNNN